MPTSILNAGHGDSDPGVVANGLIERDINMNVAKIAKELMEYNGITVPPIISGSDLNEVIRKVNEIHAKTPVGIAHSIHHNAGGGDGSETIHSVNFGQATVFAKILQEEFDKLGQNRHGDGFVTKLSSDGVHDYYGFIRSTDPSAVISEFAFLDTIDSQAIDTYEEQYAEAEAIAKAHCRFYGITYRSPIQPPIPSSTSIMYRIILDGKQISAVSNQDAAVAEVKRQVDAGQAQKGIVQRNTDGTSVFEYTKAQTPAPVPVTSTVPKTPIIGTETTTAAQCWQFLSRHNPSAPDIIPHYKKHGEALGIRWGYAVAQMIKETGYLKFGGDVKPEQNNFAGIGAVGGGATGATFLTPEDGVIAQLQHLFAYASTDSLGDYVQIDPRFGLVTRGSCPNWEDLNGRWAVPGVGYGEDIVRIYNEMANEVVVPSSVIEDNDIYLSVRVRQSKADAVVAQILAMGYACKVLPLP